MAFSPRCPALRRGLALALGLGISSLASAAEAQIFCGQTSPAFPAPEFHGSTRLWPTNGFRPARPGQQLHPDRDTTQYTSNSTPCAATGHELFWGIDVVGDRVFVMYNVGISVWDVSGANAENPRRITLRDGIAGDWLHHDGAGEADGYLKDIAAIQDPSNPNQILVVASALSPIGASIWRFDRVAGTLTQAFQNTLLSSEDVDLTVSGGRVYAFMNTSSGPYVLDVTAAAALPVGCLDGDCPNGIYLGKVGDAAGSRYVATFTWGGKIYMAISNGGGPVFAPMPEIWEVNPAFPSASVRRYRGTNNDTHSPVFFAKGGIPYLAVVQSKRIRIYDASGCLDADGCGSLPSPAVDHALGPQSWTYNFLTYSVSEGTPFLYYGFEGIFTQGAAAERLLDLSNLGTGNPLSEITETGGTYVDECNLQPGIGYWSSYYELNDGGYRNYAPRKGKFNGRYFYKVNTGTFDVHVRTVIIQNPTVTTVATSPAPYYFDNTVRFGASALNCDGPETWTWNASGAAIGLGMGGNAASLTFPLCGDSRCPDQDIEVWAIKAACASAGNLTLNRATIHVVDPRPQIATLEVMPSSTLPNVYPVCSVLDFSADVSGQAPLGYGWSVRNGAGELLLSGNAPTLRWNTAGTSFGPEIFLDGFESGGTSSWSGTEGFGGGAANAKSAPLPAAAPARSLLEEVTGVGSATFAVDLEVNNPSGSPARFRREITLTALGDLSFVGAPIVATSLGGGQYRFRTVTLNATRWRWEFEDPANGAATGCQFFARCRVIDWGADDNEVTTSWATPNLDGNYRVRVQAANCLDLAPLSAELQVPVTGIPVGAPPRITAFTITATPHCSLSLNIMECLRLQAINFLVTHSGTATHYDFDWEGDGVFEQIAPVGTAVSHSYGTAGRRLPVVRVRNGSATPSAPFGLPWPLEIIN